MLTLSKVMSGSSSVSSTEELSVLEHPAVLRETSYLYMANSASSGMLPSCKDKINHNLIADDLSLSDN